MKLIAETAWHHEGDFTFMHTLVNTIINNTNADIIKFHLLLDIDEYIDKNYSLYKVLNKWMFTEIQWNEILKYSSDSNKDLMLLFNDKKSAKFGIKFEPKLIEIHSTCLNDIHLLEMLKGNLVENQKLVLGVGGSSINEIENALEILQHKNIVLMFGFQNYPTRYSDINLRKMKKIMNMFPEFEFGYADHTAWDEKYNVLITLLGAAIGMNYIEKHITIKYGEERCDWQAAITIEMFNDIAAGIKLLNQISGNGYIKLNEGEKKYSVFGPMKKAAFSCRAIKKNEVFSKEMVSFKRTEEISDLSQLEVIEMFGKTVTVDLPFNSILKKKYFEQK